MKRKKQPNPLDLRCFSGRNNAYESTSEKCLPPLPNRPVLVPRRNKKNPDFWEKAYSTRNSDLDFLEGIE